MTAVIIIFFTETQRWHRLWRYSTRFFD